jgi:uncharacterized membrane protein YqjE
LFDSLRRLLDSGLGLVQNRLELFALEFREEKARVTFLLFWTAAAAVFGLMALLLITATIVMWVPPQTRIWVLLGFSLLYLFGMIGAVLGVRHHLKHRPPPFATTLAELKKDRQWLGSRK